MKKRLKIPKLDSRVERNLVYLNLFFILVFLNIWDYAVSRELFNGMVIGILMFGLMAILWFVGTVRAVALITLISIFEFTVMSVFIVEGFELGGLVLKSVFWIPYLLMAAINGFWGLKIYSDYKERKIGAKVK